MSASSDANSLVVELAAKRDLQGLPERTDLPRSLPTFASTTPAKGKALRNEVSHAEHCIRMRAENRTDPTDTLPDLVPIHYGRKLQSPFAFYRGTVGVVAIDPFATSNIGKTRGDFHLIDFGGFGTPEHNTVVDSNNSGETLPAPWAWGRHAQHRRAD
jgi:hypothetical protein